LKRHAQLVEALFTGGPPETIHTRDGISVASFPRHRSDHYFLHVDNAKEASRRNQITLNRFDVTLPNPPPLRIPDQRLSRLCVVSKGATMRSQADY
jgi:hypothetical protein